MHVFILSNTTVLKLKIIVEYSGHSNEERTLNFSCKSVHSFFLVGRGFQKDALNQH